MVGGFLEVRRKDASISQSCFCCCAVTLEFHTKTGWLFTTAALEFSLCHLAQTLGHQPFLGRSQFDDALKGLVRQTQESRLFCRLLGREGGDRLALFKQREAVTGHRLLALRSNLQRGGVVLDLGLQCVDFALKAFVLGCNSSRHLLVLKCVSLAVSLHALQLALALRHIGFFFGDFAKGTVGFLSATFLKRRSLCIRFLLSGGGL